MPINNSLTSEMRNNDKKSIKTLDFSENVENNSVYKSEQ